MPVARRVADAAAGPGADGPAFVMDDVAVTHRQLALRAAAVAAGLRTVPARRRDWLTADARLLAIATGNHPVFAELFTGGTAGDGACAVLDPQWGVRQAEAVLTRLRPDLLVVGDEGSALRGPAAALGVPVLVADGGPDGYEAWREAHQPAGFQGLLTVGQDGSAFLVGFTSGTTGVPKAFRRSRGSWRASLALGRTAWGMDATRHTFAPGPLAHGLSLYALAECLEAGAAFHGLTRFGGGAFAERLAAGSVRRLVVAPTMLSALCSAAGDRRFPGVDHVVTGAARLPPELLPPAARVLPAARVTEYYGASELGFVTRRELGPLPQAARRAGQDDEPDVGTAFPGVELAVRDEKGAALPAGGTGTVWVRTPLACDGYLWGDGGFRTEDGWATVGDLGRLGSDGRLRLAGRGGMVITGGLNVYLAEVEQALTALPGIDQALVTGVPDDYLGRALVAVVTGPGVAGLSQARLRELCRPSLARYKVPRRLYTLDAWPLTASGKIARGVVEGWIADAGPRLVPLPPGDDDG
ncbi:AMP-binding protein [Streptantibioticus cattleyicolor]|uniref:Putative long-chain-fatty-acid--CoA ligase protein n=1 Tax=Streptantibioticus cattleyicolor (strain ATCC 35852 / DSM 46488 / JCM 4925 / NBRC 14057 / NRRL 8057) TaxID=1003195 RepID=F8JJU9_STREN|nr:AMP-binding protein [Streptantibioticus cattleyicolor]AEW98625.1 putative long-chain-fatty-acid--CoA ligase protein [Streptantibioticus cattleyicolor NRRL 8057 = DSM 46488]CCB72316.1 Acyl-CoA synthetase [Streptantibioticus cattleyicolor NRRL 8057 = DSM 46488]